MSQVAAGFVATEAASVDVSGVGIDDSVLFQAGVLTIDTTAAPPDRVKRRLAR